MNFTDYGKAQAKAEPLPTIDATGATAHMLACQYDAGMKIVLTGQDVNGRRFRKTANSVYGAYATMRAVWGLQRAWQVLPDGRRKLLMQR